MSIQAEKIALQKNAVLSTTAYYLSFIALGLSMAVVGPTLPSLAENTGATLAAISALLAIRALGYMLGAPTAGWLYDRRSGNPLMAGALLLIGAGMLLVPALRSLWMMVVIFFLIGLVQSMVDVGGNTMIIWVHGNKVSMFMNAMHFSFGVGTLIAPLIVAQAVLRTGEIDWAYRILAVLIMLPAIFIFRLPSPSAEKTPGRAENSGTQDIVLLIFCALFFFFYIGAEGSFADLVFTYGTRTGLVDKISGAYLTAAFWGIFTFSRLISIPLAARFRPNVILLMDCIGSLIGLLLVMIGAGQSATILWVGTLIFGFFIAPAFPTMFSLAEESMHISGKITSIFFIGGSAGGMLFPWLIGQMFEPLGASSMLITIFCCMVMTLVSFLVTRWRVKTRSSAR